MFNYIDVSPGDPSAPMFYTGPTAAAPGATSTSFLPGGLLPQPQPGPNITDLAVGDFCGGGRVFRNAAGAHWFLTFRVARSMFP